ncbi:hypothetical protein ACRS8P_17850 [Burkholderia cenocepacia]
MNKQLTQKELNQLVDNLATTLIYNGSTNSIGELMSLIDCSMMDSKSNDLLSTLFWKFYKNTNIPPALPIFTFLSYVSAWCVKNEARIQIPLMKKPSELDTWVMLLAPSGSSKTMSASVIKDLIPNDVEGNKVVEPNFTKPNGPAAFIKDLKELDNGDSVRVFYQQDEAAQLISQMEIEGSPLSELREYFLKAKDHEKLSRNNVKEKVITSPVVMVQLFINTIDSMAKYISDTSLKDGLVRRYQIALTENDPDLDFTNISLIDFSKIQTDDMVEKFHDVFYQDINSKTYEFSNGCTKLYQEAYRLFWHKQYSKWMTGMNNIYTTYMMEAFKYAAFHHMINMKDGYIIEEESFQWALKVVMYQLNSFEKFILYRAKQPHKLAIQKNKLENITNWIKLNETKPSFGMRAFCRKFSMTKDVAITTLINIKTNNPKFKTSLFDNDNFVEKQKEISKKRRLAQLKAPSTNEIDDAFNWTDDEIDNCLS